MTKKKIKATDIPTFEEARNILRKTIRKKIDRKAVEIARLRNLLIEDFNISVEDYKGTQWYISYKREDDYRLSESLYTFVSQKEKCKDCGQVLKK